MGSICIWTKEYWPNSRDKFINYASKKKSGTWTLTAFMQFTRGSHKTLVTSLRTALFLCWKQEVRLLEDWFSSDAALLEHCLRVGFWSCFLEGLGGGNPTDMDKPLARARVIRTVGSPNLAAVAFSLFISSRLVEQLCKVCIAVSEEPEKRISNSK